MFSKYFLNGNTKEMGNSGCSFRRSQNPRATIAEKASPLPCKLCEQFLPEDILEKRIQCMSSPTNLWEKKPRSKTSDRKWSGSVQAEVLTYAELDTSKPGTQHHQWQGVNSIPTYTEFSYTTPSQNLPRRRGGRKKGRDGENALIHPRNHPSIALPERSTKYSNSDF